MSSTFPVTLTYASFVIGIFSFCLTILNLLALYSNFLATIRAAPEEIRDELGNLRIQILEEREALRQQTRELRAKKAAIRDATRRAAPPPPSRQHPAHRGRPRSASRSFDNLRSMNNLGNVYSLTYSEQTLSVHYQTIRDLWRKFKALERPFLIANDARAEQVHRGAPWGEDDSVVTEKGVVREDNVEMHPGEVPQPRPSTAAVDVVDTSYSLLYQCDFMHRIIWWQSKKDVLKLADTVQSVMLRRMEREVTCVRMMMKQLRDGGDGPEDINNVRFDTGVGLGIMMGENRSRGPTPMGMMRRPIGETYNVYESSDSGSDSGTRMKRRIDELDNGSRMQLPPPPANQSRPPSAGQRNDSFEIRQANEPGRRQQGQGSHQLQHPRVADINTRAPAPVIMQSPPQSRPKTRHGYEGSPRMPQSPYDGRR